ISKGFGQGKAVQLGHLGAQAPFAFQRGSPYVKTAIIHEWLTTYAGSEKALEQIVGLYPESDFYCVVDFLPEQERKFLAEKVVRTSFIQSLPFAKTKYRNYLPLMPMAVEQFDLSAYELIISSSHA